MNDFNYHGLMPAIVTAVDDPEKRGRVRLMVPDLFTDPETGDILETPWCEGRHEWFHVPPVGAHVWVTTRFSSDGSIYQLIWDHGRPGADEDGKSRAPLIAQGEDDETAGALKAGTPFPIPSADTALELPATSPGAAPRRTARTGSVTIPGIPPTANAGVYPTNSVLKTEGGLTVEVDDTMGAERIHIWHPQGTYVEINAAGVWTERRVKAWSETTEHDTKFIGGDLRERVNGNVLRGVGKNSVEDVTGRKVILASELDIQTRMHMLQEVGGTFNRTVNGLVRDQALADRIVSTGQHLTATTAGKTSYFTGGDIGVLSLGSINLNAAQGIRFNVPTPLLGVTIGSVPLPPGAGEAVYAAMALVHHVPLVALFELVLTTLLEHTHPVEGALASPSVEIIAALSPATTGPLLAPRALATTKLFSE